ncbi:MAG TPA: hypothetical protein VGA19_11520 [Rhodospirillales bacterium]|jgi:hypothetical protein
MAVNPVPPGGNLDQILAALRRALQQERAVAQIVEQATEAQKAANAGATATRGTVLDIEA